MDCASRFTAAFLGIMEVAQMSAPDGLSSILIFPDKVPKLNVGASAPDAGSRLFREILLHPRDHLVQSSDLWLWTGGQTMAHAIHVNCFSWDSQVS